MMTSSNTEFHHSNIFTRSADIINYFETGRGKWYHKPVYERIYEEINIENCAPKVDTKMGPFSQSPRRNMPLDSSLCGNPE